MSLRPRLSLVLGFFLASLALVAATSFAANPTPNGDFPLDYYEPPEPTALRTFKMQQMLMDEQEPHDLAALSDAPCVDGMAAGYACDNVDLMSFLPLDEIGGGSGNDIWGWTDRETGHEYALMGRTTGTSFVDITDPLNPIYLGDLPTQTTSSTWRDIKVYNDHAFIVSEARDHGMQIYDLTQLRDITSPPVEITTTAWYGGFGSAHNLAINTTSGYAFGVGTNTCRGGPHIVNIQNPAAPVFAGCYATDGYTHDLQCVEYHGPDGYYNGRDVCFNFNEDTLTIADTTNPSVVWQVSRKSYSGAAYTHQGWLNDDHSLLMVDDELDERNRGGGTITFIWDVSKLANPLMIGRYVASTPAIDHNQYIHNGFNYQANYRAGLRILDVGCLSQNPATEVAYFDIYPDDDEPAFNGAWSVYPYFDSGNVIVSGIEQGLYVLRPTVPGTGGGLRASESDEASSLMGASNVLRAAVASNESVRVEIDGPMAVGGFNIYRSDAATDLGSRLGGPPTTTTRTYTDPGVLGDGIDHFYQMRSLNGCGVESDE